MCDTFVATANGSPTLFAKNSDRQRNEAQAVEMHGRARHRSGEALRRTYMSIPQVTETNAILICRPFWMWGAEMGVNEFGVAIGNEGLQARSASPQEPRLLGMDLLRLGLERARSAAEALDVIVKLLEAYGQGGNGGHMNPSFYNNGFIIADPREAYVLETVDRDWAVERVEGVRTISNTYSVGASVSAQSAGLDQLCSTLAGAGDNARDLARILTNPESQFISQSGERSARSASLLAQTGQLSVAAMMAALRDHGAQDHWAPLDPTRRTLCMHACTHQMTSQTTGSMVSGLEAANAIHWVTATSAPCISIFKPLSLEAPPPLQEPKLTDHYDSSTLWWRHERLYRRALAADYNQFLEAISGERDALELEFRERVDTAQRTGSRETLSETIATCWRRAEETEARWAQFAAVGEAEPSLSLSTWREFNQRAGLELDDAVAN